jgi:exosortase A-associated hydrolase 2
MTQRIITFQSAGRKLHGVIRHGEEAAPRGLVVICDPFAEEKKCAHRPLVDVARRLCLEGFSVLRFDYRGCGDSGGDFEDSTPADWLADIHAAIDFGKSELGVASVGLAGLRMGATLADHAAREREDIKWLMLWEPILDGKRYVAQNLRRSLVKAMLTEGEEFDAQGVTSEPADDAIDFDGYLVSAAMREQLEALRLSDGEDCFSGPTLVLNIGPRDEPGQAYAEAAAAYRDGIARGIRLEPFWNRIGLMDARALGEVCLEWVDGTAA